MGTRKRKQAPGQISVNKNRGWLRLRFPDKFRKYQEEKGNKWPLYVSLYLKEVDPETQVNNWPRAEAIAAAINQDWLNGPENMDITLKKYLGELYREPKKAPAYPFPVGRDVWGRNPTTVLIKDIWMSYTEHHLVGKKLSTQKVYDDYYKKLVPWLNRPVSKDVAKEIRKEFIEANNYLVKNAIAALASAVNWAMAEELYFGGNPFLGISQQIFPGKRVDKITGLPFEFVAFTSDEVDLILESFRENALTYYSFFKFKFLTGCRTGEAIALTWNDVKFTHRVIHFNKTYLSKNSIVSKGTKGRRNGCQQRRFPLSDNLFAWLTKFKSTFAKETDLVFPNRNGGFFDQAALSSVWGNVNPDNGRKIGIVSSLAMEGKLNYLPPYNTRHTFINFCLDQGLDPRTIADWCGNSDDVIQKVYKSRSRDIDLSKMPQW